MSQGDELSQVKGVPVAKSRLQGMRIRDEFLCPITYELFREPVVASDGHTYEKLSIEKWLKSKTTSPRTGKPMDKYLTPNLNMQKLIQDMIEEGGANLYTADVTDANRLFYVYAQKSLMMKCLGPPESTWNQQVFEVSQSGCIGGRRVPTLPPPRNDPSSSYIDRESVQFDDSTVSRIHFEIMYDSAGQHYSIRDLGSAGGTFIRIPFGKKKQLLVGSMILLGKHQFKVSSIEPVQQEAVTPSISSRFQTGDSKAGSENKCGDNEDLVFHDTKSSSLEAIVGDAEALLSALEELSIGSRNSSHEGNCWERSNQQHQTALIQARVQRLREAASLLSPSSVQPLNTERQQESQHVVAEEKDTNHVGTTNIKQTKEHHIVEEAHDAVDMRLKLICFAPEGSPLIGMSYYVGRGGASLGRAKNNGVALMVDDRSIDNSVSQEHAHIVMDKESGAFFLGDGNPAKASTNGTWYRLSSPHHKSAPHELKPGMEASERMTIKEELIE